MKNFDDLLESAAQNRPTRDVKVCLDGEIVRERDELVEALEAAKKKDAGDARLAGANDQHAAPIQERLDALAEAAQASLVVLRFTRLGGAKWAELTSRHPVRVGVQIDMHYGYNYDAVCGAAAVESGVRVEGDEEIPMTPEQWAKLLEVLSGNEVQLIRDAVWGLNEFEPAQRLGELVKGFGAAERSEKN